MRDLRDDGMDDHDVGESEPALKTARGRPVAANEVMRLGAVIFAVYLVFIVAILAAAFVIGAMAR
jgi:hypothetical protein